MPVAGWAWARSVRMDGLRSLAQGPNPNLIKTLFLTILDYLPGKLNSNQNYADEEILCNPEILIILLENGFVLCVNAHGSCQLWLVSLRNVYKSLVKTFGTSMFLGSSLKIKLLPEIKLGLLE